MGLLDKLRAGLARTKEQFLSRLDGIAGEPPSADPRQHGAHAVERAPRTATRAVPLETIEGLEEALISADVGVAATEQIVRAVQAHQDGGDLRARVKEEIRRILEGAADNKRRSFQDVGGQRSSPWVVLVVGVNGTGKTTTVGKLARLLKEEGMLPIIGAADTFRAAAVEQLEIWANRAGVDIIRAKQGTDPAAVVFDAVVSAKAKGRQAVIVDTAGRLHTRVNLMAELEKMKRVAAREVPGAPHEVLLVLDATVGQNGLAQAREFLQAAGVTGIVLTKLDGTAKGGIAVAIAHDLKLPIRYVGVGEAIDDLVPFSADDYVNALFEEKW